MSVKSITQLAIDFLFENDRNPYLIYSFIHDHGYGKELINTYFAFATHTKNSTCIRVYNCIARCEMFFKIIYKGTNILVVSCVQYSDKSEKGLRSCQKNGKFCYYVDGKFIGNNIRNKTIHDKIGNITNLLIKQRICPLLSSLLLKESKDICVMIDKSQINPLIFS